MLSIGKESRTLEKVRDRRTRKMRCSKTKRSEAVRKLEDLPSLLP